MDINKQDKPDKSRIMAKKKFLRFFRKGFDDPKYVAWERGYKWDAHEQWEQLLNQQEYQRLLKNKDYKEIANRATRLETRTNLLFSFEKMALRDAVKSDDGAKAFAIGLYDYVYGDGPQQNRFEKFKDVLLALPRRQTRVLTWPLLTVFGFLAKPKEFIFVKPQVTKTAARNYGYELDYTARPNWNTYQTILAFAGQIKKDVRDLHPRDYIDLQSFIWVLGSSEYD